MLSIALNFDVVSEKITKKEKTSSVKSTITTLPKVTADENKFETVNVLGNVKFLSPKISNDKLVPITNIQSNSIIVSLSVDRGNDTVALDGDDSNSKELLQNEIVNLNARNPTEELTDVRTFLLNLKEIKFLKMQFFLIYMIFLRFTRRFILG